MSLGRLIVIDDEKNITFVIKAMLERAGFEALVFNDSRLALEAIDSEAAVGGLDTVITDLYMPLVGGMEVLAHCRKNFPQLPVVMITAFGTVEAAVTALKQGAFDFITKPFDQTDLLNVVQKAVQTSRQREFEPSTLGTNTATRVSALQGESAAVAELKRTISKVAPSSSSVLISGEIGTEKELVANEIHLSSPRKNGPLIRVNCSAVPSALMDGELFGYERGAFSGAVASKPGRFELAHEGTLLLEDISELPSDVQAKLVKVLQEKKVERSGGLNSIPVDVRVVATSARDLQASVKSGEFREDLYYQLATLPVRVPPLRERLEDLPILVSRFIDQFNHKLGKTISGMNVDCIPVLQKFGWPGNLRQLENVIERTILMTESENLQIRDLPEELTELVHNSDLGWDESTKSFKEIVRHRTQNLERELIEKALSETSGNVTRAAERLGLSRKGLQLKLKELGVKR
ncbi:sigma-54 dependent transcriptional regulator [bacterium]|nr:sigma-54 dependent transcriptional regulator [bacterium]